MDKTGLVEMNYRKIFGSFFRQLHSSLGKANLYHLLAIVVSWCGVLYLVMVAFTKDGFDFPKLVDYFSAVCSFAGTLWICAGVCYEKPQRSFKTLQELETHVVDTFSVASGHCLTGIVLLAVSFMCQQPLIRSLLGA